MYLVVITPEQIQENEAALLTDMLRMGVGRVHLRHPGAIVEELDEIVESIPSDMHGKLTLHDHFELTSKHPDVGVQLNSRNPEAPANGRGKVSRSCHTVREAIEVDADYVTLSPFFPSISKKGYRGEGFSEAEIQSLPNGRVVALGGITAERIKQLKRYPNIAGVAVLGTVWQSDNPLETVEKLLKEL